MDSPDLTQLLSIVGVVLTVVALPPAAAVPVLTPVIGLLVGAQLRNRG
jgi:hypothetical protein